MGQVYYTSKPNWGDTFASLLQGFLSSKEKAELRKQEEERYKLEREFRDKQFEAGRSDVLSASIERDWARNHQQAQETEAKNKQRAQAEALIRLSKNKNAFSNPIQSKAFSADDNSRTYDEQYREDYAIVFGKPLLSEEELNIKNPTWKFDLEQAAKDAAREDAQKHEAEQAEKDRKNRVLTANIGVEGRITTTKLKYGVDGRGHPNYNKLTSYEKNIIDNNSNRIRSAAGRIDSLKIELSNQDLTPEAVASKHALIKDLESEIKAKESENENILDPAAKQRKIAAYLGKL